MPASQTSHVSAVQPFLDKLRELQSPEKQPMKKTSQQISPATRSPMPKRCKRKNKMAMEDWGSLSFDDDEPRNYMAAMVYHGGTDSIRQFMLRKRLRRCLVEVQEQAAATKMPAASQEMHLVTPSDLIGMKTPTFGKKLQTSSSSLLVTATAPLDALDSKSDDGRLSVPGSPPG
jgi:hypothetical protein